MEERVTITALRARNLPRTHLLFAPTALLEIHTTPGGAPNGTTIPVPRSCNPVWRNFTHVHTLRHLCGPITVGFVVRDANGAPPVGRVILSIDAALVEGWFTLRPDAVPAAVSAAFRAELYVRISRPTYCFSRPLQCARAMPRPKLRPVQSNAEGELRSVASQTGLLFRRGELVVSVEAKGVPATVKEPYIELCTDDQSVRGFETVASREDWRTRLVLGVAPVAGIEHACDGDANANSGDHGGANMSATDEVSKEADTGGQRARPSVSAVVKSTAKAVGKRTLGSTSLHLEALAPAVELPGIVKVASNYALGLARNQSTRVAAIDSEDVAATSEDFRAEEHTASKNKGNIDVASAVKGEAECPAGDEVAATVDVIVKTNSVGRNSSGDDDDIGEDDSGSEEDGDFMEFDSGGQGPEDVEDIGADDKRATSPRRAVDFGSFRFAVVDGFLPSMLHVVLQDKASSLPQPLKTLGDHTVRIPKLPHFTCCCSKNCNTHVFRMRLTSSGAESTKIVIQLVIAYNAHTPRATYTDVTKRFRDVFSNDDRPALDIKSRFPHAKDLVYLFVGGLFTTHYPTYFEKNTGYLKDILHFPHVHSVPIHTEGSIERNARIIADEIKTKERGLRSVVLVGHSKGGVDAISVLRSFPDAASHLFGIISFQAPFGGTYLIDYVYQSKFAASAISSLIETVWKGDKDSVADMSYASRLLSFGIPVDYSPPEDMTPNTRQGEKPTKTNENVFEDRSWKRYVAEERLNALRSVPIVAFASRASFDVLRIRNAATAAGFASMAPLAQVILQNTGFACDGLVTPVDGIVPHADMVALSDMMHTEPALYVIGTKYPPGKLTACAILLLSEKVKRESGISALHT